MQENELRIGRYYKSEAIRVIERGKPILIRDEEIILITKSILLEYLQEGNYEFSPIPLTEDHLLSFGLKPKTCDWFVKEGVFSVYIDPKGGIRFLFKDYRLELDIDYVHEFQNLIFDLTREELTIKEKSKL